MWIGFIQRQVLGSYEHANEPSGSMPGNYFLAYLSDCQLINNGAKLRSYI